MVGKFPINYRKDPSEGVLVGLFGNSWLEINFQPTLPINYRKDPSEGVLVGLFGKLARKVFRRVFLHR